MYYDDNFGHWEDMDDPDMREFYLDVQRRSVVKKCVLCRRKVKILPQYDKCDNCTRQIETGIDPMGIDPSDASDNCQCEDYPCCGHKRY